MAVSAPLVFKQAAAEGALERQLITVDLLMTLQVAQTAEGDEEEIDVKQPLRRVVLLTKANFLTKTNSSREYIANKINYLKDFSGSNGLCCLGLSFPDISNQVTFSFKGMLKFYQFQYYQYSAI